MRGSSRDIEAHAHWIRWRVNWYGVLWVGIAQTLFYLMLIAAVTVTAATI